MVSADDVVCAEDGKALSGRTRRTGDTAFRKDYAWLRRWASHRAGDVNAGEDIASQAFVELLRIDDAQTIDHPRALLKTIALRLICDQHRRAKVERRYLSDISEMPHELIESAEHNLIVRDSLRLVERALADLSPNARSAFLYSQIDGLTYAEIGRRLGVSTSRVQQYMAAAFRNCAKMADQ